MNLSLLLAGTVSHNPTDILLGGIILAAGLNGGVFGLERWVLPFIRKTVFKQNNSIKKHENFKVKPAI